MKSSFREYGVILALIVVSVSGYLLFSQNKEDILAYSLDILGTKLVALIDDETAKQRVAEAFSRFQEQVMNQEVSAEQVELVAANVLNLTNSGTRLSLEEAELVLTMNPESFANSLPSPDPNFFGDTEPPLEVKSPLPPQVVASRIIQLAQLGENLEVMFEFSNAVEDETKGATRFIRFDSDENGMHVIVDPELEKLFQSGKLKPVTEELDRKNLVRWQKELEKDASRRAKWFESEAKKLANVQVYEVQSAERADRIQTLARIRHLQSLGITTGMDSAAISLEIGQIMTAIGGAMKEVGKINVVRRDSLSRRRQ
ncbi:MAG: hypothetical protein O3B41_09475 [Bacteroidetes bacterium]|nr:hypothetical protein [Bacteroidota bacterium]